jgi:hypothetical protein
MRDLWAAPSWPDSNVQACREELVAEDKKEVDSDMIALRPCTHPLPLHNAHARLGEPAARELRKREVEYSNMESRTWASKLASPRLRPSQDYRVSDVQGLCTLTVVVGLSSSVESGPMFSS